MKHLGWRTQGRAVAGGHVRLHRHPWHHPALQKLKYDPVADFEPIGMVAASPTVLVAHSAVPAKNVQELVQLIKAKPGIFSYASAGNGTAPHIAGELFKLAKHPEINKHVTRVQLAGSCDPMNNLGQAGVMVDRVLASLRS